MRAVIGAGLCLAVLVPAPPAAAAATAAALSDPVAARTVTLVTGDRLLVGGDGTTVSRLPGDDRAGVPLVVRTVAGHLEVVPADAAPLVSADRLDPRLFDVTTALTRRPGDLPLIVEGGPAAAVRAVTDGAEVRELPTLDALAVRVDDARLPRLWDSVRSGAYRKVWLDGVAEPSIDVSVPLVGAPAAWAAGWTGAGIGVGVLDTGVDTDHPDLAQAVAESADFTTGGDGVDRQGHGTHVASIIAGSGAASAGRYRGMAPDVKLYSAKVCTVDGCPESAILAGMEWAARDRGLRVVNLSLGEPDGPGTDLLEEAVDTLSQRFGTLFVAAAGNTGAGLASPASADAALAVGATTMDDRVAPFSDPGPRASDGALKPDIAAPGEDIVAARSGDSALPGGAYTSMSGTSVAAPHVAGAAALLAQQHPDWTPAQLKAALMGSATPLGAAGYGRLDVAKAVAGAVLATPASVSFGPLATPADRTVTYHNDGPQPVTLDLAVTAPFTVDAPAVTVPGGGDAEVRVTADGPGTGTLTATAGDVDVRTVLSAARAPRTATLTVKYLDRTGAATTATLGAVSGPAGRTRLPNTSGTGTIALPVGTYALDVQLFADGRTTLLSRPALVLRGDTTVVMDARAGRPVTVAAPGPGVTPVYAAVSTDDVTVQTGGRSALSTAQLGPGRPGLRTTVAGTWAGPGELYALAWTVTGRFVTGFTPAVRPADLATVTAGYAGTGTGTVTRGGWTTTLALPARRTEHLSAGVAWGAEVDATTARPRAYAAAGSYDERWNEPVVGPVFTAGHGISRDGGTLTVDPVWSDASGVHLSEPAGPFTVTRDGRPAARTGLPAAPARFTVTGNGTTWTFRSGATDRPTPLPLPVVRLRPSADRTSLGFTVEHQSGTAPTTAFTLRVSYDDGRSWRRPLYTRAGDRGVALLRAPAPGSAVSVRVSAADAAGNTVEQTMIRAYGR